MRLADQIEAIADRAVADLHSIQAIHARRSQPHADADDAVDDDPLSDEEDD